MQFSRCAYLWWPSLLSPYPGGLRKPGWGFSRRASVPTNPWRAGGAPPPPGVRPALNSQNQPATGTARPLLNPARKSPDGRFLLPEERFQSRGHQRAIEEFLRSQFSWFAARHPKRKRIRELPGNSVRPRGASQWLTTNASPAPWALPQGTVRPAAPAPTAGSGAVWIPGSRVDRGPEDRLRSRSARKPSRRFYKLLTLLPLLLIRELPVDRGRLGAFI